MTATNENIYFDGYMTMKKWIENRNAGKTFADYFLECGYKRIAIYDASDMGILLYDEIKGSEVEVVYFVDHNAEGLQKVDNIPVILVQDVEDMEKKSPVDIMVISPIVEYTKIVALLMHFAPEIPTLSLKDAVYEF